MTLCLAVDGPIPIYLPPDKPLPREGLSLYRHPGEGGLYLVWTDAGGGLLTVSLVPLGNLRSLAAVFALLFLISGLGACAAGTAFLRRYFVLNQGRPRTVEEALKFGEGPSVEFKRSISFDIPNSVEQVLETVAAFANTGDGTIFIGIEDDGKIKGVPVGGVKEKDWLAQRIYEVVRRRIKPLPWMRVEFVDARGFTICIVFIPRGEERLYFLDGVVWVRHGPSDIKADPAVVNKLLEEYAF